MIGTRCRRATRAILFILLLATVAGRALGQAATPVTRGVDWLASQQSANGTWTALPELAPRDTARVLIALSLHRSSSPAITAGVAWLGSQRGFDANQFLAEQALALSLARVDASAGLERLSQQRSLSGPDYGGFADHTGTSYDSALALQALATQETKYLTPIAGVVTTLITRQNPDGGWGIDTGFTSHPVITAEVLAALSSTAAQQAPPATVAAAQAYLAARMNADGSIGTGALETATSFRALALSGYPLSATATATLNYLAAQQSANGSWSSDVYLTARVLEAYAANKSNLAIRAGDFTLNPTQVSDGASVSASVKVSNIGSAVTNAATTVKLYVGDAKGRELASTSFATLAAGATRTVTLSFTATSLVGTQTIAAVVDAGNTVDEMRKDDNSATATLAVAGKPDLQVFSADIVTAPARLQPGTEGALNVTIRNNGEGEARNAGYAIYHAAGGGAETLLKKGVVESVAAEGAAVVSLPITLPAGTHTIRVVADPDAQVTESNESNNAASKSISVTAAANVDLRIRAGQVTADPQRPAAGQSFTISATIDNAGLERVSSTVAFYDGVPNAGGVVIAVMPVTIAPQSNARVQIAHVATAESRVVYAVADADDLLPEVDEANNAAHALLTDQYADLVLTREGFVIPRATLTSGAKLEARLVVRNTGILPANGVRLVVHDDLPQSGGIKVLDTTVDVPAMGKVVVPVSWNVRAGQRFATAAINDGHTVFEPSYANNRVTKLYTPRGTASDLRLNGTRGVAIDSTGLIVNQATLTISGSAAVHLSTSVSVPFTVTLFEDVDGDLAFNPEVDTALGSTHVPVGTSTQRVVVGAQGTVRFAPGKLVLHIDSSNAVAETDEANNFVDLWQDCRNEAAAFAPGIKWRTTSPTANLAPVARFRDTNGDDVIDDNDAPYIVHGSRGSIALYRGDTGQRLWSRNFGFFNRQISPAIGDLDGDGVAEILAANYSHKIVALDVDGNTKWQSPELPIHPDWEPWLSFRDFTYVGAPVIADLEGDGTAEVIVGKAVLNGANGTIKWIGGGSSGRAFRDSGYDLYLDNFPDQEAPITVDLNGDGKLEVVAGSTAYKADGTILWHRGELGDGYAGAVTLPGQTTPSIALVAHGRITMLRADGTTAWGPINLPNGARMGGAPTIFMDGTTGPWVGVAGDGWYSVFNATTGAVRWTKPTTTDLSFGIITTNAATAFNFGTGMTLAYAARKNFYLLRASDGAILYDLPNTHLLFHPTAPVVADVDGDGRTDIAVTGSDGLKIISDPRWNGTRGVFNQLSYNVVNVANDRAGIPLVVTPTADSRTHFRTNVSQPATAVGVTGQPNLTASYMRADTSGFPASAKLTVRAGNNGWLKSIDTKVAFYRVSGTTTTFIGTAPLRELAPGDYDDVTFTFADPPADTTAFHAVVDQGEAANSGEVAECNESDNKSQNVSVLLKTDIIVGASALAISDAQPRRGETIELVANAEITSAVNAANVRAQFFLGDPATGGTAISAPLPVTVSNDGDRRFVNVTSAWNVTAPEGPQTIVVLFDPLNAIAEADEANNKASFAVTVGASVGQPDLQLFAADINTSPSRLQPGQQATITVTIRNGGKGDAPAVGWALYDVVGATSTLLARGTTGALPIGAGQIVSATATLAGGTRNIRAVVDPENAVPESNETNNEASRAISVSPASNVDLKVAGVTATPSRPAAGQSVTIRATVENGGSEAADAKLGFYDGVPGHGGTLVALVPLLVEAQSSVALERTYSVTAGSIVAYAVADPDNVLPEIDESNNAAHAVLTDNYVDLAVTRDEIVLSSANVSVGQTVTANVTIRNRGAVAASAVPVVIYDDAPASGGRAVYETTVDVPAQGSAAVAASFAARGGQRFATVVVNASRAVVETDFSNNRATRFYTGSGDEPDLSLDTTVARNVAIDTSAVVVNASELSITGTVKLRLDAPGTKTFTVMIFEDADGDLAYDSEVDSSLGSTLVTAGVTPQSVNVGVQGNLRFAPGKLAVYLDSSNAVSETDESNNLLELWQDCRSGDFPRPNLTASYMRVDGSAYPGSARFIARVGNNGLLQSPGTGVAFYAIRNGAPVLLGRSGVTALRPGQYADVVFVLANPPADITGVYAVADDTGTSSSLPECNESDNTTPTAPVQFSADVAVLQAMLGVTDPEPRQSDTIDFAATARVTGAVTASQLVAQFYLGDPNAGGEAISGLLPTTILTQNDERIAKVSFRWTVTAAPGNHGVFVVFDPNGVIAEDAEDNNRGIYSLAVSTPDPVRKLSGGVTLTPPTAEPGMPVKVELLAKNSGNVTLENVVIEYHVVGGSGAGLTGSAKLTKLEKNDLVSLTLGQFTPAANGEYTVSVKASDPAVTLFATPKIINVAPFASGALDVAPQKVPVAIPLIQAHTRVSRTNTILLPDDPLVPLIKTHIQKGVNWMTAAVKTEMGACFRCHAQAQGLAGLESARRVSGINVETQTALALFNEITRTQNSNGTWHSGSFVTSTTSGAWALALYGDPDQALPSLTKSLDYLLNAENSDGGYTCDECRISFAGRETVSMFAMVAYARGHEITPKATWQQQMVGLAKYGLAYDYAAQRQNPERAARIAIGLAHMIPQLEDAGLRASAEGRVQDIALFLRNVQNADGTFGTSTFPDYPVIRTAQSLYALALAGAKGNDPALRSSTLWLLNSQRPAGGWSELRSEFNAPVHWYDESTWAIIALPAAFLRLGQFDVDLQITLPDTSALENATPPANRSQAVPGGRLYLWNLTDVTEEGYDVYLDIRLKGIENDEVRAATGAAALHYKNPYSDAAVTRNLSVPSVIGVAPLEVSVTTDAPAYPAQANVGIDEVIRNVGSTREGITNEVVIKDANGLVVGTVTANEPVIGLPATVFPGWHYAVPITFAVQNGGTGRVVAVDVDFARYLSELGVTGTFETHSIRVSADSSPAAELYYSFTPAAGTPHAGQLHITIPDEAPAGATLALHVFFDTLENGVKPVSMFNIARTGSGGSQGLLSRWWTTDQSRTHWNVMKPEELIPLGGVRHTSIITTTHLGSYQPAPPILPWDFWFNIWTGAIYVPTTGTYRFACETDDGCWIDIDGVRVVENPGAHGVIWREGSRHLTAGFHSFKMTFYEVNFSHWENIWWAPPGKGWSAMSGSTLYTAMPAASPGSAVVGTPKKIVHGSVAPHYVWNTGMTAAGDYSVVATLRQFGTFATSAAAKFAITPVSELTGTVATDKPAYDSGETVRVQASAAYGKGNVTLTSLTATVSVVDAFGATVGSAVTPIATLLPGQSAPARLDWPAGASAPGTYTASLVVKNAAGATLAQSSVPFEIRPTSQTGKGVTGTIAAPATMHAKRRVPINVTVTNGGNTALSDAPFSVVVLDPVTQQPAIAFDFTASLAPGATHSASFSWPTTAETPQRVYDAFLVSRVSAATPLAQTKIKIIEPAFSRMTATVAAGAAAYDCNDTASVAAVVTYDAGNVTRSDVTATVTIVDPSGLTVATGNATAATFAVGDTLRAPLTWTTGTSMPGTYTANVIVRDAEETYAQAAGSFEVRSTAATGRCLTGTLGAAKPWVYEGDPLAFTPAVHNGGNAALAAAPFAVVIADPATEAQVASLSVAVDAAKGATFTGSVTWNTTAAKPQLYRARLVSLITGTPVPLAETSFEVKERPFSKMSASVSSDAPAYDCNAAVGVTAAVVYTAGNVVRGDVTATATLTAPNGTVVATSARTAATFTVGDTLTVPLQWNSGSSAPGTYVVTVVVRDANETYAQATTAFEVRSSAVTGACISGTLAAPESVFQPEPVPFAVTIANSGNAALAGAPFAVVLTHPTSGADVATLNVTVTAAVGATFAADLTWPTATLTPQFYRARLVSLIAGTAVTLAERVVEVKVPPLKLDLSIGAPPRVLIWADCANGNSAAPCTPVAPAFVTATLDAARIPWTLVGTQEAFLDALRTGAYDEAILYQQGPYEAKIMAEYLDTIRGGTGLLLIKAHPDAMPKLAPALGTSFGGTLKATSTVVELLDTPFTSAGQLTLHGDGVKMALEGAQPAARILATQAPAISYHTFGAGRVVVVPFDLEKSRTDDVARLIVGAVRHVARPRSFDARRVIGIDFKVTPPPGAPASLTIAAQLPPGVTLVHAQPALATTDPPSWNVTAAGTELHLYLWVRLPNDVGTYTITGTAAFSGQVPVVTKTIAVEVTADRAAMENALHAALTALAQSAPAKDQKAVGDAQSQLAAIRAANPADKAGVVAVIERVVTLIENLQSVSVDTTTARNAADRILAWWQSRAGV